MRTPNLKTLLVFAFLAATVPRPAGGQTGKPLPPPAAAWRFDEGAGVDAAPISGGAHGTLRGGAAWTNGLVGAHALALPGQPGSFVDVPGPVLDTAHSYTVMACVKLNRAAGYQTFVSIDGTQISGFFLQFRDDTDEFAITVPPADSTSGNAATASSDIAPEPGVWYHLAGVFDADAHLLTLYVNGIPRQTVPCANPWSASGHTAIGRGKYGGNPVDFVNGAVDEVRLFNVALSAAAL